MVETVQTLQKAGLTRSVSRPWRAQGSTWRKDAILLGLFLVIAFGLGYATLNRYDPRNTGVSDTGCYYHMASWEYRDVEAPYRFRVLVPTLVAGVQKLLPKAIGTWNTLSLAFLIVDAAFVALTAWMVGRIAASCAPLPLCDIVASFLYLCSYVVVNEHMVGLVDAGEAFFFTAIMLATVRGRLLLLPFLAIMGVAAKETVIYWSAAFWFAWWLPEIIQRGWTANRRGLGVVIASLLAGTLTIVGLHATVGDHADEYHQASLSLLKAMPRNLLSCVATPSHVYTFAYLAPLGVFGLAHVPARLRHALLVTALFALALSAYANIGGNAHRPMFASLGPLLSVASSIWLVRLGMPTSMHTPAEGGAAHLDHLY